jgi:dihydroorotate dehydrogenase
MSIALPRNIDGIDLSDRLEKAVEFVNCIIMAAGSIGDRDKMNAIASVGYSAVEIIEEVQEQLQKDGGAP